MYELIKEVITSKSYELTDMLKKIDTLWVEGKIDEPQRDELIQLARENANPEESKPEVTARLTKLEFDVKTLDERVKKLEGGGGVSPEPGPEYPEFVLGKSYYKGDKITYAGEHYECIYTDGMPCVWSPTDYPDGWKKVA